MKDFARLFTAVDQTTRTTAKTKALAEFFREASDDDKLWTIALFSGRRPKRAVTTTQLREWASERAGIPLWLLEESYPIVGDLAETIALVLPPASQETDRPTVVALDQGPARTRSGRYRRAARPDPRRVGPTRRDRAVPL